MKGSLEFKTRKLFVFGTVPAGGGIVAKAHPPLFD
jgi:hypothetical protein